MKTTKNNRRKPSVPVDIGVKVRDEFEKNERWFAMLERDYQNRQKLELPENKAKFEAYQSKKGEMAQSVNRRKIEIDKAYASLRQTLLDALDQGSPLQAMNAYKMSVEEFFHMDSKLTADANSISIPVISYYNKLMSDLSRTDSRFALFISPESFVERYNINLRGLDDTSRAFLKIRLEKAGVTKNKSFLEKYAKFFPEYIGLLSDFTDIKTSLKIDPSVYVDIDGQMKLILSQNPKKMSDLLSSVHGIFEYMSMKEIYSVAEINPNLIGKILLEQPKFIEKLDDSFFEDHHPKYIFSVSKKIARETLQDYIARFPSLIAYYGDDIVTADSTVTIS